MTWQWRDLDDGLGVLEPYVPYPAELTVFYSPYEGGQLRAVWVHALTGQPIWWPDVGDA